MKLESKFFLWSAFASVVLFIIIKEMINTFPEWLSFLLIIVWAVAIGYSLIGYPIILITDFVNCTKGEQDD